MVGKKCFSGRGRGRRVRGVKKTKFAVLRYELVKEFLKEENSHLSYLNLDEHSHPRLISPSCWNKQNSNLSLFEGAEDAWYLLHSLLQLSLPLSPNTLFYSCPSMEVLLLIVKWVGYDGMNLESQPAFHRQENCKFEASLGYTVITTQWKWSILPNRHNTNILIWNHLGFHCNASNW